MKNVSAHGYLVASSSLILHGLENVSTRSSLPPRLRTLRTCWEVWSKMLIINVKTLLITDPKLPQFLNNPTVHQLWHNAQYGLRRPQCIYRSHSSRSTSISSFKSKLLQLHWQWEMDLIAREQLVSSLKNHTVRRGFFYLTHLWIPRVLQWEGYGERLENTNVNIEFSFFLRNVWFIVYSLWSYMILCVKAHAQTGYMYHERALKFPIMYNKFKLVFDWICCSWRCVILLLITPLLQTCNEMTHWSDIWLYLNADGATVMTPGQCFQPNILYL